MPRSPREWIEAVDRHGLIHRIDVEVDRDEEMAAITYARQRSQEEAPALLFENVAGYPGHRTLWNISSTSKRRVALVVGEDPSLSELELIDRVRDKFDRRVPPNSNPRTG